MAEVNTIEQEYFEERYSRLNTARHLSVQKKILSRTAQRVAQKLNQEIALGHETTAFLIAISISITKDLLDILQLGFPFFSFFLGLILVYFLWGKGHFLRTKIRIFWWILGLFLDNLPLVSVLPIQTIMVLWAWRIVHKNAGVAGYKLVNLDNLTESEIKKIDEDIEILVNE